MTEIDLSEIEGAQRSDAAVQAELAEREAAERAKLAEIRKRIERGDSTGDALKDLVIVRTERLDREVVELYRDLSARVAAHVGEPVLVVGHAEKQTSFGGPHSRRQPKGMIVPRRALAIINNEALVVDRTEGSWEFPADGYALLGPEGGLSTSETVRTAEGNLRTGVVLDRMHSIFRGGSPYEGVIGETLELRFDSNWVGEIFRQGPPRELEVFVGHDEISTYLERDLDALFHVQRNTRDYNRLAEALGLERRPILSRDDFEDAYVARQNARDGSGKGLED